MIKTRIFLYLILCSMLLASSCRRSTDSAAELLDQGVHALDSNDLIRAYHFTQLSIEASEEAKDSSVELEAKTFLGILYCTMGQDQEAYNIIKTMPMDSARGRRDRVFQLGLNCMAYYAATIEHDYKKALAYNQSIIARDSSENNIDILYSDQLNTAEIFILVGDTASARRIVESVDTTKIVADNMRCAAQLRMVQSLLMMHGHRYNQARHYCYQIISKPSYYWDINNNINALQTICTIDSLRGNIRAYAEARNQMDSLKTRVQGSQMKYKIQLLEEQYRIENLKLNVAKRQQMYNSGMALLIVIVLSLSIIAYMQWRKTKIQKRINEMERNNLDADIQRRRLENELLTLKMQKQKEELTQAYQENVNMSMMLDESPDSNSYATRLDYLESVLKRQYGDFMKRLSRRYPRLSYNESLIIGFTRMKLSSKDIAAALGISQESLTKARYRLRKKIGVASAEELDAIIEAI